MAKSSDSETAKQIRLTEENQLQEVLGPPPSWMLRWGISLVAILLIFGFLLSIWIKYPDVIPANIQITSTNPAVRVVALSNGQIEDILIADGDSVQANQLLLRLKTSASYSSVQALDSFVQAAQAFHLAQDYHSIQVPLSLSLGELQKPFADYIAALEDYQALLKTTEVEEIVQSVAAQIQFRKALHDSLMQQINTLEAQLQIGKTQLERQEKLVQDTSVSLAVKENAELNYLQQQQAIEVLRSQGVMNNIEIERLRKDNLNTRLSENRTSIDKRLLCENAFQNLQSTLANWKLTKLITAPVAGQISMPQIWRTHQFVAVSQEVLTIIPDGKQATRLGKAEMPPARIGKVETGYQVNIRLASYPYREYGQIKGEVKHISPVPENELYYIEVQFPDTSLTTNGDLLTTYGDTIRFKEEMAGIAEVVTERRSLLERVLDSILSYFYNES